MSIAIATAVAALCAQIVAAFGARAWLSWLAAALTATSLLWRLPAVGASVIGLSAALGLSLAAARDRDPVLHRLAALAVVPSAFFAAAPPSAGWLALSLGAVSALATALVVWAVVRSTRKPSQMAGAVGAIAALVLVALPAPASFVAPLAGAAEWPLGVSPAASLHRGPLLLDTSTVATWALLLWSSLPWVGAAAVAVVYALGRRSARAVWIGALLILAAAAVGMWPVAGSWLDGSVSSVVGDPRLFPLTARASESARQVDAGAALWLLVRWVFAAAILHRTTASDRENPVDSTVQQGEVHDRSPHLLDVAIVAAGAFALALSAVFAAGFIGPYWLLDSVSMALIALCLASSSLVVVSASVPFRRGVSAGVLRGLQLLAAAMLLGGGDLGWRVASVLLAG